jgi:hypothetical protein
VTVAPPTLDAGGAPLRLPVHLRPRETTMPSTALKLGGLAAAALAGFVALLLLSVGSSAAPEPPAAFERPQAPPLELPAAPATTAVPTQQRTFVSGTGSDANPCTRTAPCRNFQRAIDETLTGGEVIVLDSAGYGPVTITRGIQLISPAGVYAGITAFSGAAINVNVPAGEKVVLRGLTLNGLGANYGIYVSSVGRLYVQQLVIKNFTLTGLYMRSDGASDARFVVEDTVLHDNEYGIWCEFGAGIPRGTIDGVRLEHGFAGVISYDMCRLSVRDSVATGNTYGFLSNLGGSMNVEHSEATHNGTGIVSGATMRVSETLISENEVGVSGSVTSFGNNSLGGNTTNGAFTTTIPES